jgi:hypothetical protein
VRNKKITNKQAGKKNKKNIDFEIENINSQIYGNLLVEKEANFAMHHENRKLRHAALARLISEKCNYQGAIPIRIFEAAEEHFAHKSKFE